MQYSVFVDFGNDFIVLDDNGEEPLTADLSSVEFKQVGTGDMKEGRNIVKTIVKTLDNAYHGLSVGDYIKFMNVDGLRGDMYLVHDIIGLFLGVLMDRYSFLHSFRI
jgi:hypothetical protein